MHIASTIYIFNEPGQEQNQIKCVMGSAKNLIPKIIYHEKTNPQAEGRKKPTWVLRRPFASGIEVPNSSPAMERERDQAMERERSGYEQRDPAMERERERDPAMERETRRWREREIQLWRERERSLGRRWAAALAVEGGRRILAERDFENFGEKKWEKWREGRAVCFRS
jgi:hypothetical protein